MPVDVILLIVEHSTPVVALALSQTCRQLQHLCARRHLRQLGIFNPGRITTDIHLVGGPFSISSVLLLRYLTCDTSRTSIIVDFYHVTTFLRDIQLFLRTHVVNSFEVTLLDDERCLLDGPNISGALPNVFLHLSKHCNLLRFTAGTKRVSRSLLNQWVLVNTPMPSHFSIRKALASVKEFHLSSSLFHLRSFNDLISILLLHPTITYLTLEGSTASDAEGVLSKTYLPALEYLSVRASDSTLVVIPDTFSKSHFRIRSIHLSALFLWDLQSFTPSMARITLPSPSLASATVSSKYAGFDVLGSSSFMDLHVYAFMAFPFPQNRGYCNVVQSLVDVWLHSKAFRPIDPSRFTASFTFPRRLSDHLAFCEESSMYRCSCAAASLHGKKVHGVQRVNIFLDNLNHRAVVCPYSLY